MLGRPTCSGWANAGGWFQRVPLVRAVADPAAATLSITRNGRTISLRAQDQFLPMADFNVAEGEVTAPAVFVGQALQRIRGGVRSQIVAEHSLSAAVVAPPDGALPAQQVDLVAVDVANEHRVRVLAGQALDEG